MKYTNDSEKTLFKHPELNWEIIQDYDPDNRETFVYGSHQECRDKYDKEGVYRSWFLDDPKPVCFSCDAEVPAEIQALIIMYTGSI